MRACFVSVSVSLRSLHVKSERNCRSDRLERICCLRRSRCPRSFFASSKRSQGLKPAYVPLCLSSNVVGNRKRNFHLSMLPIEMLGVREVRMVVEGHVRILRLNHRADPSRPFVYRVTCFDQTHSLRTNTKEKSILHECRRSMLNQKRWTKAHHIPNSRDTWGRLFSLRLAG